MRGKKAKEKRREQGDRGPAGPKVVGRMVITVVDTNDGKHHVSVEGIPKDFDAAMNWITVATKAVAGSFVKSARESREESRIVVPKGPVLIGGKRIH